MTCHPVVPHPPSFSALHRLDGRVGDIDYREDVVEGEPDLHDRGAFHGRQNDE